MLTFPDIGIAELRYKTLSNFPKNDHLSSINKGISTNNILEQYLFVNMTTSNYGKQNNATTEKFLVLVFFTMLFPEFHILPSVGPTTSNYTLGKQLKMIAMEANRPQIMKNDAALELQHEVCSNINTLFALLSLGPNML